MVDVTAPHVPLILFVRSESLGPAHSQRGEEMTQRTAGGNRWGQSQRLPSTRRDRAYEVLCVFCFVLFSVPGTISGSNPGPSVKALFLSSGKYERAFSVGCHTVCFCCFALREWLLPKRDTHGGGGILAAACPHLCSRRDEGDRVRGEGQQEGQLTRVGYLSNTFSLALSTPSLGCAKKRMRLMSF